MSPVSVGSRVVGVFVLTALLFASPSSAQRTPYLQRVTTDEATVVWREAGGTGRVCYGTAMGTLDAEVAADSEDVSGQRQHVARIEGLSADTLYYYDAGFGPCPASATAGHTFRTAPPVGDRDPFRVWVVGDSGNGSSRQEAVRDSMIANVGAQRPDLFVHVGDMAYSDGRDDEFTENFYDIYADILLNTPCWPAIGNHEANSANSGTESGAYYEGYVLPRGAEAGGVPSGTEAYYSFDYANVHFVVLDSADSGRDTDDPMLEWLVEDLAAADQEWLIAYWHHPPYTKGSHDSDVEGSLITMRENALPILEANGVHLVIGGHSHIYERSFLVRGAYDTPTTAEGFIVDDGDGRIDGDGAYDMSGATVYMVAGHGGVGTSGDADHPLMFFSELENGSVILDIDGGQLTLRNIRSDGVESDHATLVQGEGLYLLSPTGGETFLSGAALPIRWSAVGVTPTTLDVEFSVDGGTIWRPIALGTEDDGEVEWVAPAIETETMLVRIRDTDNPALMDMSAPFRLINVSDTTLVPFSATWEYSDGPDAPPSDWRTTTGGWAEGDAPLGYGDDDETTVLLDADPNIPTVYFRRSVTIDATVDSMDLEVLFDDAIAVWINDILVLEENVEDGLDHDIFASRSSGDDERAVMTLDPAIFVDGENIIAALVKQSSAGSSDLSFDLRLTGSVSVELPSDAGLPPPTDAGPGPDAAASPSDASARPDIPGVDTNGPAPENDGSSAVPPPGLEPDNRVLVGGCGCRANGNTQGPWALVLLLVVGLHFRRRRR